LSNHTYIQKGLFILENILAFMRVSAHQILTGTQITSKISFCNFFINQSKSKENNSGNQVISQNASSIEKGSTNKVFSRKYLKTLSEISE
jgi:hypothetical protein